MTVATASAAEEWGDPTPLPGDGTRAPFPTDVLPLPVRAMVEAVAASTGAPIDLAALVALGVISTAVVGGVEIQISKSWTEPAALYLCGIAAPAEGKTPIVRHLANPLWSIERARQEAARPEISDDLTVRELLEARKANAVRKGEDQEALEAARELSDMGSPKTPPRLVTQDATPESLVRLLHRNRGRLGIVSDEGGEVFELMRRYTSSGGPNLGIYLKGWDGEPYVEDRASREPRLIPRATLTMALLVQPVVVHELLAKAQEVGRGLAARYLMAWPASNVGKRSTDRPHLDERISAAWTDLIESLAAQAFANDEPVRLCFSTEARRQHQTWHRAHEPRLDPLAGDFSGIAEWAGKLPGQLARLALILHVAEIGNLSDEVSEETMVRSIRLGDYFCSHTLHVYGAARADDRTRDAVAVLDRLRSSEVPEPTIRELSRRLHWPADQVREALQVLVEYGHVRLDQHRSGGRPSEVVVLHPSVRPETSNPVTKGTKGSTEPTFVTSVTRFEEPDDETKAGRPLRLVSEDTPDDDESPQITGRRPLENVDDCEAPNLENFADSEFPDYEGEDQSESLEEAWL